ncbi:MAG: hypothetical protein A3B62_05275, partial [Rhodospirillales bacterium RIFCSPLOWO2_01_FULL_65_14]
MRFTIGRKFASLLAAFLALQVLQLSIGIYQVWHVSEEAELLSGAAKVRPLFLAELGRRALTPGSQQAKHQQAFLERFALHDGIYQRLREEYAPRRADKRYGALATVAMQASESWEQELRPLLLAMDPARPQAAAAALARFEALAPAQVEHIARIVMYLEQDIGEEAREAMRMHASIFSLSMLFALVAVWGVRRQFTLPLRALAEVSRAMAEGNYDRRLAVASRDELGALAGAFNRMAGAVEARTLQLSALNHVAIAITSSSSLQDILNEIMRSGIHLTGARAACIAFYDQGVGRFKEWVTQGLSEHFVQNMAFRPGGLADETFTTTTVGTYILSNDRPETQHKLSKLTHDEGIKCFICLPLTSHAHHLGVIYVYRDDRDTFESPEIELLTTFARLAAETIESARLRERLAGEARTDALTGLYNRREFEQRLVEEQARAKRYGKPYAFMMLDIDHFKQVNDVHGHAAGDIVLKTLADVLRKQLRDADIPARHGGEEFAVIFPEINDTAAKKVAERVRRAVAATPFRLPDGREIGVTVSIGVSSYPKDADTPREVVDCADRALYAA